MNLIKSLYHQYQRRRTLQTDTIYSMPIAILMPHSACNCLCVMCDIWKDNQQLKQLTPDDIAGLLHSLKKLGVQQVLMSGGEALLNPHFFQLCSLLQEENITISLLSTGLTLKQHATSLVKHVKEIIVSLDGDAATHNQIRNIPTAFSKMAMGIQAIRELDPGFIIRTRTVIHRINFHLWPSIIDTAKIIGADSVSFLPADTSSHAFNREVLWSEQRQSEVLISADELTALTTMIEYIIDRYAADFATGFITESPAKLRLIGQYYAACHGLADFPYKKCNAPWVSVVIEADGMVRPCFFHPPLGNIKNQALTDIVNSEKAIQFRKNLDMGSNSTCVKCVCYLHLPAGAGIR